jgi:hypothetical protein
LAREMVSVPSRVSYYYLLPPLALDGDAPLFLLRNGDVSSVSSASPTLR